MNGDRDEGQEEEDEIAHGQFPVGRNGDAHQLRRYGVHFVSQTGQDVSRYANIQNRVVRDQYEDSVGISGEPGVILT